MERVRESMSIRSEVVGRGRGRALLEVIVDDGGAVVGDIEKVCGFIDRQIYGA